MMFYRTKQNADSTTLMALIRQAMLIPLKTMELTALTDGATDMVREHGRVSGRELAGEPRLRKILTMPSTNGSIMHGKVSRKRTKTDIVFTEDRTSRSQNQKVCFIFYKNLRFF